MVVDETVRLPRAIPERARANATAGPPERQIAALDGLRGLAVLAVMAVHFDRFLPSVGILIACKAVFAYGWAGIDLFFALSGFLITGVLLRTRDAANYFGAFYMRRVLRVFPIYYATLAVVFSASAFLPNANDHLPLPSERWLYVAYLANWIAVWKHPWPPNVLGHFWSLAVEEQFYLVWPVCVFALSRRRLLHVAGILAVVALAWRCFWVVASGPNDGITLATISRMDSLLIGAAGAIVYLRTGTRRPLRGLVALTVVPLVAFVAGIHAFRGSFAFVQSVGFSLLGLGFGALVLGVAVNDGRPDPLQRALRNPLLRRIGRYSYGMYVYHVPLMGVCELLLFARLPKALVVQPLFAVCYVAVLALATFALAAASFELVEKRILGLKRYFVPACAPVEACRLEAV